MRRLYIYIHTMAIRKWDLSRARVEGPIHVYYVVLTPSVGSHGERVKLTSSPLQGVTSRFKATV